MAATNYTYAKLKGRIVEKYETRDKFAEAVGISPASLSYRLSGKVGLTQSDIVTWAEALDIPSEKYEEYFFA